MTRERDYDAYGRWLGREPGNPNLPWDSWVRLMPKELGGGTIRGQIKWLDGSGHSYAVVVPYGEDGALIYIHRADVEPCDSPT